MTSLPRNMLEKRDRVNNQDALSGVIAMATGGRLGEVPNISTTPYGLVGLRTASTIDLVAYAVTNQNNAFVVRMPNNVADPGDAVQVLVPPNDITALPPSYVGGGPDWNLNNIGSLPLGLEIPRDYKIEENFETGMLCASEGTLTITTLQAGIVSLTGTLTTAVIPSPVPRVSLNKAGLMSNVGSSGDIKLTAVNCAPVVIGAGDGMPYTFAGNNVDDPDTYQFLADVNFGASQTAFLGAYAGGNNIGGLPDYITSPVSGTWNTIVNASALPVGVTALMTTFVSFDFAYVSPTGILAIKSTTVSGSEYISGPTPALFLRVAGSARVSNPTKDALGFSSYLIGVRTTTNLINVNTLAPLPFTGGATSLGITMPNQGPSFRAGDKVILLQNYVGPYTFLYNQHWMARPNVNRQADYRGQLRVPYPSLYRDAVLDCVYTTLGASMGRAFADRTEFELFLREMDNPQMIYRAISHPEPGVTPHSVQEQGLVETENSARAPVLQAARYRVDANLPHSQYNSSFWTGLTSLGRTVLRKALPVVAPEITNALSALLDGDDYKSSRYSASSSIPVYGTASYHATAYGEDTIDGDEDDSFDPLECKDAPEDVRSYVQQKKRENDTDPDNFDPILGEFLYRAKYIELSTPDVRLRWIRRYMEGEHPTLDCLYFACSCCFPAGPGGSFRASSAPQEVKRVEFVPTRTTLRAQPVITPFNHHEVVANALNAAGYVPGQPTSRNVLTTLGVENVGKLRSSDPEDPYAFEPYQSGGEEMGDDDDVFSVPVEVKRPPAPKKPVVAPKKPAPKTKLPPQQEIPLPDVDEYVEQDNEGKLDFRSGDYPSLSATQLQKMMTPVTNGAFYNCLSSGAGPILSGKHAARIIGFSKPAGNNFPANAANFVLVGLGGVYVATVIVSSLPVNREFNNFPAQAEGVKLAAYLRKSYHLSAVSKTRPGPGGKPETLNYHVGLEFGESTIPAVQRVVDLYHAISKPPIGAHRYISVELHGRPIDPGGIAGDSFSVALLCALLGLPCGPAITGALKSDGTIGMVGDLNAKLGPFYRNPEQKLGPLIFPAGQIAFRDSQNFSLMCNMNSWSYVMETNAYEVASVRDVFSFFTGGGYTAWLARIDPLANKVATMDRINTAVVAALQVAGIKSQLLKNKQMAERLAADEDLDDETRAERLFQTEERRKIFWEQLQHARKALTEEFVHEPVVPKKDKKSVVALNNGVANTSLQRYESAKNNLFGKELRGGKFTKKIGALKLYPGNFPVKALAGQEVPEGKRKLLWAYKMLQGDFYEDGKDWTFVINLFPYTPEEQELSFEQLFNE